MGRTLHERADLDGDGAGELVACAAQRGLAVFDRLGDEACRRIPVLGDRLRWLDVAVGDLDGNERAELVGVVRGRGRSAVLVLTDVVIDAAALDFRRPASYELITDHLLADCNPRAVAAGDLNADGHIDLLLSLNARGRPRTRCAPASEMILLGPRHERGVLLDPAGHESSTGVTILNGRGLRSSAQPDWPGIVDSLWLHPLPESDGDALESTHEVSR